ncbi:MAG TPA: hypothetical protein VFO41_08700 [Alphaproteobacteria bacterium]|nr:hypothetical protein [Alphaproteobacteria bacterium]
MTISPPLAVLAILAVSVAAVSWWAPEPPRTTRVTVDLPPAVYDGLAEQVDGRRGADGRPLTIAQAIADLASRSVLEGGAAPRSAPSSP